MAGPGACYYQKRRRQQLSRVEHQEAGDDYFSGIKPQLEDTAISPETAWRASKSTSDDGPIVVSEVATAGQVPPRLTALGTNYAHPNILSSGPTGSSFQALGTSNEGRRPELSANIVRPPPLEIRADKSPPVIPVTGKDSQAPANFSNESREVFSRSDESIQLPTLPGPILPPKNTKQSVLRKSMHLEKGNGAIRHSRFAKTGYIE